MAAILQSFLVQLAERRYRENDLSDITWALCETLPEVRELLAGFCGVTISTGSVVRIEREFLIGSGCRVDFACWADDVPIFIESKIYDRNYHLAQYGREVSRRGTKLVLISNHYLDPDHFAEARKLGWKVCQWRDLVGYLEPYASADSSGLISAYLEYVKQVCNMVDLHPLRFTGESLYSLVSLSTIIEELIGGASHKPFKYLRYKTSSDRGPSWAGAYYEVLHELSGLRIWPFFGLMFETPQPYLCVMVESSWNNAFLDCHRGQLKIAKTNFEVRENTKHDRVLRVPDKILDDLLNRLGNAPET